MCPDRVTFVDFETRSKADLRKVGGRIYAEHPTTEVVCAVLYSGHALTHWLPGNPAPAFVRGFTACAHNAVGFDRYVWRRLGWPEPAKWYDTAQLARVAGYPKASLDWLGTHLLGVPKDSEGSKLTRALSTVWPATSRRKVGGVWTKVPHALAGRFKLATIPADVLARVVAYCRSDVEILEGIWPLLAPFVDVDTAVRDADLTIIDRGFAFDRELADVLVMASAHLAAEAQEAAGVCAADVKSPAKLLDDLEAELGYRPPNAQAATLEEILANGELTPAAQALIEARIGSSTIAAGKLTAGLLRCSPDGRLRDSIRYYGAHTGRWAGVGLQPHNLPRG